MVKYRSVESQVKVKSQSGLDIGGHDTYPSLYLIATAPQVNIVTDYALDAVNILLKFCSYTQKR